MIHSFDKLIETIRRILDFETYYIGDRTIDGIHKNPADKRLIEETVEKLKYEQHSEGIEVTLSCGNKITLSI